MAFEASWVRSRKAANVVAASVSVLGKQFSKPQETSSRLRSLGGYNEATQINLDSRRTGRLSTWCSRYGHQRIAGRDTRYAMRVVEVMRCRSFLLFSATRHRNMQPRFKIANRHY